MQALGLLVKAPNTKLPIQSPWLSIMNRQRCRAGLGVRDAAPPSDEWGF